MNSNETAKNIACLNELLNRSKDAGVVNHLIIVDDEGPLALPDDKERLAAVNSKRQDL